MDSVWLFGFSYISLKTDFRSDKGRDIRWWHGRVRAWLHSINLLFLVKQTRFGSLTWRINCEQFILELEHFESGLHIPLCKSVNCLREKKCPQDLGSKFMGPFWILSRPVGPMRNSTTQPKTCEGANNIGQQIPLNHGMVVRKTEEFCAWKDETVKFW